MSFGAVGIELSVNQQYILNEESFKRNTKQGYVLIG